MVVTVLMNDGGQVECQLAVHVGERTFHLSNVLKDNTMPMDW